MSRLILVVAALVVTSVSVSSAAKAEETDFLDITYLHGKNDAPVFPRDPAALALRLDHAIDSRWRINGEFLHWRGERRPTGALDMTEASLGVAHALPVFNGGALAIHAGVTRTGASLGDSTADLDSDGEYLAFELRGPVAPTLEGSLYLERQRQTLDRLDDGRLNGTDYVTEKRVSVTRWVGRHWGITLGWLSRNDALNAWQAGVRMQF